MKIFLSYSTEDKPVVRNLFLDLKSKGLEVFLDEIELHISDNLEIELQNNLNQSQIFLLIWSKHANKKWVKWEIDQAIKRAIVGRLKIITASLDTSERPEEIKDHIFIDLRYSYRRGIAQLCGLIFNENVICVFPGDELYRVNIQDLEWAIDTINYKPKTNWNITLDDAGFFEKINKIYQTPISLYPNDSFKPGVANTERFTQVSYGNSIFNIASVIAGQIVMFGLKNLELTPYNKALILQSTKAYLSWVFAITFKQISCYITNREFNLLDTLTKKKLDNLFDLIKRLEENGLGGNGDPIDLLFGVELPHNKRHFECVDLVVDEINRDVYGYPGVLLYLPINKKYCALNWPNQLISSDWPPPKNYLNINEWFTIFIPQIARDMTLLAIGNRGLLQKYELKNLFEIENFSRIGYH